MDGPPFLSRKLGPKNQFNIPNEYLATMGISAGEHVYIGPNPDRPGTLVLVPMAAMALMLEKGWTSLG